MTRKRWWWLSFAKRHGGDSTTAFVVFVASQRFEDAVRTSQAIIGDPIRVLNLRAPRPPRTTCYCAAVTIGGEQLRIVGGALPVPPTPAYRNRKLSEADARAAQDAVLFATGIALACAKRRRPNAPSTLAADPTNEM